MAWDEMCCALAGHRLLLRMMWDFCFLLFAKLPVARPMAGLLCLSRDQEQKEARAWAGR